MELNQDIKGQKLEEIFKFLNSISDRISIERYCAERIPEDEFEKVQREYKEHILETDRERREGYDIDKNGIRKALRKHLGIKNDKEANKYFDRLLEQDLEVLNLVKNDGEKRAVNTITEDVITKKYTRVAATTQGPIMQQYYIKVGELLKRIEQGMTSLFSFPYHINNEEYENLTFYKNEKMIFSICSHEKYAILNEDLRKELLKIINS